MPFVAEIFCNPVCLAALAIFAALWKIGLRYDMEIWGFCNGLLGW